MARKSAAITASMTQRCSSCDTAEMSWSARAMAAAMLGQHHARWLGDEFATLFARSKAKFGSHGLSDFGNRDARKAAHQRRGHGVDQLQDLRAGHPLVRFAAHGMDAALYFGDLANLAKIARLAPVEISRGRCVQRHAAVRAKLADCRLATFAAVFGHACCPWGNELRVTVLSVTRDSWLKSATC